MAKDKINEHGAEAWVKDPNRQHHNKPSNKAASEIELSKSHWVDAGNHHSHTARKKNSLRQEGELGPNWSSTGNLRAGNCLWQYFSVPSFPDSWTNTCHRSANQAIIASMDATGLDRLSIYSSLPTELSHCAAAHRLRYSPCLEGLTV